MHAFAAEGGQVDLARRQVLEAQALVQTVSGWGGGKEHGDAEAGGLVEAPADQEGAGAPALVFGFRLEVDEVWRGSGLPGARALSLSLSLAGAGALPALTHVGLAAHQPLAPL